jgi:AraC family transcriptional regulator, transcriptional activator of pobA
VYNKTTFIKTTVMKYCDNSTIIKEYRDVFRKHANDGIIDMDHYLKHSFSFQIHRLEQVIEAWKGIIPAYRQSQFFITLIKKGRGEKTIGHLSFPIQKNTLLVIPQKVPQSSKYRSLDCSGFMLSFDEGFFFQHFLPKHLIARKRIFSKSGKPFMVLTPKQASKLSVIFEYLIEEYNGQLNNKDEMIATKVLELLLQSDRYIAHEESEQNADSNNELVDSFNQLIQKNVKTERSVQFYADALHIHPNHLNFLMKKYTGTTAKQTIIDHLFLEAKHLLDSTSLSIKEIAYDLGFASPGCFSSFFKKMSDIPIKIPARTPLN